MSPEYTKDENALNSKFGQSFAISILAIAMLTIVLPLVIPSGNTAPSQANAIEMQSSVKAIGQK
jgi:hypothetical protein